LQIDHNCQVINPDIFGQEANKSEVVAAWFYQRTRQISWTDRRYHRYNLAFWGKRIVSEHCYLRKIKYLWTLCSGSFRGTSA